MIDHAAPSTRPAAARRGRPGVQLEDVCAAADALIAQGLKPTIERVRRHLGGGSPNTVSPLLDEWFARLPQRLVGVAAPESKAAADGPPLAVVQAAEQFWAVARREAEQAQRQATEAERRTLELERAALAEQEADLQQREGTFAQTRAKLDEALAAANQALAAMQAQMHVQQQESARLLSDSEAEVRRLRKSLEDAVGSKEALRETMAAALTQQQRAAKEAEERHRVHERRLLAEVDRERLATAKAVADLAKAQKAHAAEAETSRNALLAAQQALHQEQGTRREGEAAASQQVQALRVELATWRERASSADARVQDLAAQLQRQGEQAEREITQLRESQAATVAAVRQLEARQKTGPSASKSPRAKKPAT